MLLSTLKSKLQDQYDIDCFIFLEDLERSPSSTLYQSLIPFIKDSYHNEYRFVFFNFVPVDTTTLIHVLNTINYLDISPYFVEVISNQQDTIEFFKKNNIKVDEESVTLPNYNLNHHMCAYAWTGLHVNPNGQVRICCEYTDTITKTNNQPFNIRTDTINDIVNSEYMINIRKEFRQGKVPTGCNQCVQKELHGKESKRQLSPYKLKNIYGTINWDDDTVSPKFLGGHFGNLCNLKCRICDPFYSSSIAVEQLENVSKEELPEHPTYKLLDENKWAKSSQMFWSEVKQQSSFRNFEFLGGEPLLLKENLEFMQHLLDTGLSKQSVFEFVTNGTQFPKVLESADRFERLTFSISIDSIGDRFEYQRKNAKWSEVSTNVKKFISLKSLNPNIKIGVSITVNIQNVLYLPELIEWINSQGVDHYYYSILTHPAYLGVGKLTPNAKTLVLSRLINSGLSSYDQDKLNYVIQYIQQQMTSDGIEFVQKISELDKIRNEDFRRSHSEIAEAMGFPAL